MRKRERHELRMKDGSILAALREMNDWNETDFYKEGSSYIFIQVGLLQVYHFKLDPLQNLFQRLTCFVVQLLT